MKYLGRGSLYFSGVTGLVLFLFGIPVFLQKMYGTTVFHLLPVTRNCLIICRYRYFNIKKNQFFGTNYLKIPSIINNFWSEKVTWWYYGIWQQIDGVVVEAPLFNLNRNWGSNFFDYFRLIYLSEVSITNTAKVT